ncbi:hypothetical protein EON64_17525 [archaeon]|nr:MAG: hypothetical protein EON64_17525 [archaeon]
MGEAQQLEYGSCLGDEHQLAHYLVAQTNQVELLAGRSAAIEVLAICVTYALTPVCVLGPIMFAVGVEEARRNLAH